MIINICLTNNFLEKIFLTNVKIPVVVYKVLINRFLQWIVG